ncbi:hypothetical protein EPO15_13950 [bacterium]|nr:MAG: hypothetical protein EPO15_13950 [bacterium]
MTPVEATVAYLGTPEALKSLERDPYWPKWDSPWWHMTLLWELGLARRIPKTAAQAMVKAVDKYPKFFPKTLAELPPGADPHRDIACHCALGTMFQVLTACGLDVDRELPWVRPWFLKYQLPDGGLNCDEAAYTKPVPKSSPLSTLPPLEAVLFCTRRAFTPAEEAFLDRGADYLLAHRLVRAASGAGQVIDEAWLKLTFPRYYDYDLLRGLRYLAAWSKARGKTVPGSAVRESLDALASRYPDGALLVERAGWSLARTLTVTPDGVWGKADHAADFPLLAAAGRVGAPAPALAAHWAEVAAHFGLS